MILTFSDEEEDIYNGILEIISNSKSLTWCNTFQDTEMQIGEWTIDLAQRSVVANNIEVRLTNTEFEILYLLASNPGRVFIIEQIYNIIWNYEYLGDNATISKHISSIRKKIGDSSSRQLREPCKVHSRQGTEIPTVGNSASVKGAETKPTKGTVKNVCPLCANPSHL